MRDQLYSKNVNHIQPVIYELSQDKAVLINTCGHSFLVSCGSRKATNKDYCVHVSNVKQATAQTPRLFLQLAEDLLTTHGSKPADIKNEELTTQKCSSHTGLTSETEQENPEALMLPEMMMMMYTDTELCAHTHTHNNRSDVQTHHKPRQARTPSVPYEDPRAGLEGQRLRAPAEVNSVVFLTVHVETHLSDRHILFYDNILAY